MKKRIEENKKLVKSIIRKLTGSYNEDVEQEVYIKAWKNLENYKEEGKFSHWISVIASNVCRDYFRSRNFKEKALQTSDEEILENIPTMARQEELIDEKQRQKIILKAVDSLPSKMRKMIYMYEFEELTYEEISKKTGLPEGTIKSRLFNARKILSEKLQFLKGETL